jgi:hypothetical protein
VEVRAVPAPDFKTLASFRCDYLAGCAHQPNLNEFTVTGVAQFFDLAI